MKNVSYLAIIKSIEIDCPYNYICSPLPVFFPQLQLPWFMFVVWAALEQGLSDRWGYTVRNLDNQSHVGSC
jgi:hypothetical protein